MSNDVAMLDTIITESYRSSEALLNEAQRFISHMEGQQSSGEKSKGSFGLLNMKNQEIISCLTNSALLLCKLSMGETVPAEKYVEVLLKHHKLLEKFKNINPKIKSEVDRLLGTKPQEKPLNTKTNLAIEHDDDDKDDDLDDEVEDEEDEVESEDDGNLSELEPEIKLKTKTGKLALPANEEENKKTHFRINRINKQALNSSLVKDLRKQYSDAPEEIVEGRDVIGDKFENSQKCRQKFEEDYFIRLPENKKEKHLQTKKMERSGMDSLLSFGKYMINDQNDAKLKVERKRKGAPSSLPGKKFKKSSKKGKKRKHF